MKFEAAHIALIDADGVYRVRCQSPAAADCWIYTDEAGDARLGKECQIALRLNEADPSIHGRIAVYLEIDRWNECGIEAHMVGDPFLYKGGGRDEY
jgi:hypothetical protein